LPGRLDHNRERTDLGHHRQSARVTASPAGDPQPAMMDPNATGIKRDCAPVAARRTLPTRNLNSSKFVIL
jgi:hypothetical protein